MDDEDLRELFITIVSHTVLRHENVDDVVEGAYALGERRAELLGREFSPGDDVAYVLSIFCWWPFKPSLTADSIQYLQSSRWDLFMAVSDNPSALRSLLHAIPNDILMLNNEQLFDVLREGNIRRMLRLQVLDE